MGFKIEWALFTLKLEIFFDKLLDKLQYISENHPFLHFLISLTVSILACLITLFIYFAVK